MRKVGKTLSGNVLVEVTPEEWERLARYLSLPDDIAGAVKRYRREHGLSQGALAKKLGVSRGYVSGLERGLDPNKTTLEKYRRIISMIS